MGGGRRRAGGGLHHHAGADAIHCEVPAVDRPRPAHAPGQRLLHRARPCREPGPPWAAGGGARVVAAGEGKEGWEEMLPKGVSEIIKEHRLFGFEPNKYLKEV